VGFSFGKMEKRERVIEGPVIIAGIKVYAVTDVQIGCTLGAGRLTCFGNKKPTCVVSVTDSGARAFTIEGEEVSLEWLTEEVAGIETLLESRHR
jgi:hypothetical protein